MSPAFKEWQAIVAALADGRQTIILRKGGIAEGRGGFQAKSGRFWLFPTSFHTHRDKLKPGVVQGLTDLKPDSPVELTAYAEVARHRFLDRWEEVAALDPFHLWTEATIRERFDWAKPPGLHVFVVRVHRLLQPVMLPVTAEMGGCKSWIELPARFDEHPAVPALGDEAFADLDRRLPL